MKRILVIAMLMFTVLACGPSQEGNFKGDLRIVTEKYMTDEVSFGVTLGVYSYMSGNEEKTMSIRSNSHCYRDMIVGQPLPLSCRNLIRHQVEDEGRYPSSPYWSGNEE